MAVHGGGELLRGRLLGQQMQKQEIARGGVGRLFQAALALRCGEVDEVIVQLVRAGAS